MLTRFVFFIGASTHASHKSHADNINFKTCYDLRAASKKCKARSV